MTIHIEICKSWMNDRWNIRIGDIQGNTELSNATEEDIIDEIHGEMKKEKEKCVDIQITK